MKNPAVIIIISVLVFSSCAVNQLSPGSDHLVSPSPSNGHSRQFADLTQLMRTVPGLRVTGDQENASIHINRDSSTGSEGEPLFVIDGIEIGYEYSQVYQLIDATTVQSIHALKDFGSLSRYGSRGVNGVIEINTKKNK